jgi:hypothetical protein
VPNGATGGQAVPDGKQIQKITAEGLVYLDDDGNERFIDFAAIHASNVKKRTSPEYLEKVKELNQWDDEGEKQHLKRLEKWREVAERNILGDPWGTAPYIEFHTEPPIRFEFATQDEFRTVRTAIEQFGWRTTDLT